ncbi:MAG: alpha/beta fold hydrolase [Planctomycetota bacterium]|nr:alpha/beta fold hydrolase [Planctomycetota bacterium]
MGAATLRAVKLSRYAVRCRAPLWARGGQAQTLLGYFLPVTGEALAPSLPGVARHEIRLDGEDRVVVFEAAPERAVEQVRPLEGAVVHLFHGLAGSSDSNYVRLTASVMRWAGAHVVAYNHRGQGAGAGLARGFYHSGSDLDLFASVAAARARHPGSPQLAIGFSLSANTVLLGAARRKEHPGLPDAIVAVNPPALLSVAVRRMERGFNRVYDRNFVVGMREALRIRRDLGWVGEDLVIPGGASVRTADELVTAPMAGYPDAEAYYADCSSAPRWHAVELPAVVLSAADDPFIAAEDLTGATPGPRMLVHVEPTGGHLGYLSSASPPVPGGSPRRWLGGALLHYAVELRRALG